MNQVLQQVMMSYSNSHSQFGLGFPKIGVSICPEQLCDLLEIKLHIINTVSLNMIHSYYQMRLQQLSYPVYYGICLTLFITRVVLPCSLRELSYPVHYKSCLTLFITVVVLPCSLRELSYPVHYESCFPLSQVLELDKIVTHHWMILGCSAVSGMNLLEGIDWTIDDIASRIFTMD